MTRQRTSRSSLPVINGTPHEELPVPRADTCRVAGFIGYPNRQVLAVFDDEATAKRAAEAVRVVGTPTRDVEILAGADDAARFDATGARHGLIGRLRRVMQFRLMDRVQAVAGAEAEVGA